MTSDSALVALSLDAVIVAVTNDAPRLLVVPVPEDGLPSLPSAALDAANDLTLDRGMRRAIAEQTGLDIRYAEQLYTFGDLGRRPVVEAHRAVSVAYIALVEETAPAPAAAWIDWYALLPWEDHRDGRPSVLGDRIEPALEAWARADAHRQERVGIAFGEPWDGVRVLERYELLYELGLTAERWADTGQSAAVDGVGEAMPFDHRRIVATALGRIRGKLTYRPVVFDLLPETFTLLALQRTVEALAGVRVHKQNFRRLVERSRLVEGTGERATSQGGRPAELFRYRPEVQLEQARPGLGQPYG